MTWVGHGKAVRLLVPLIVAMALMPKSASAFSASFSWSGIAACGNTSPAFRISAAPKGTTQLRFRMVDLNAVDYPHGESTVPAAPWRAAPSPM